MSEQSSISIHQRPVALVTGAARRIGARIAERLHQAGYRVLIHYHHSQTEAEQLTSRLNRAQPGTAACLRADLTDNDAITTLAEHAINHWQRIDLLVNNASRFYPTPVGEITEQDWQQLIGSNLKAPLWLSQALLPALRQQDNPCIINLIDSHARKPLEGYPLYCTAKAGLAMLTQSLAKELAPKIRVNGIAPGPILPPEGAAQRSPEAEQQTLDSTLLKRYGSPDDIADTVLFLARQSYVTGEIVTVDGGRSLS